MQDLTLTIGILRLILSAVCGALIGFDRLLSGHSAGIRTHAIVAIGSTLSVISAIAFLNTDALRIAASVVSGIGFLGVGTILARGRKDVSGLTTAAGLWTTSIIGIAIGVGQYVIAIIATFFVIILIFLVRKFDILLKKRMKEISFYVELSDASCVNEFESKLNEFGQIDSFFVTPSRSGTASNTGVEIDIRNSKEIDFESLQKQILELPYVIFITK